MRASAKHLICFVTGAVVLASAAPEAAAQYQKSLLVKRPGLSSFSNKAHETMGPGAARKCRGAVVPAAPGKSWNPAVDAITAISITRTAAPGCGPAASATFSGDSFFVNWTGDCVQPGDFVILTIRSTTPIGTGGAVWQDQFNTVVDNAAVNAVTFPALDPRGIAVLTAGLGLLGLGALKRRRTGPNAN